MLRGINRQDIFEDDGDYRQMTGCLRSLTERYDEMITRTVPMIPLSDDARHLRLHYDWRQSEPLTDIVSTLNSFESIDIELRGNTLYVK